MARLSVNVNKVATLRNSRGGRVPSPLAAVEACLDAGAKGITVHPREDRRHIVPEDLEAIATRLASLRGEVELNVEGDPRAELLEMVRRHRPDQCTLVPVRPGEITSEAGWPSNTPKAELRATIRDLQDRDVRVSLFVEPEPEPIAWAAELGADRVELYTEPYARAFAVGEDTAREAFERYRKAADRAHELGLGVNAGHDLDLDNLVLFRELPHLDEVSIGHALISRALFEGLGKVVGEYLTLLREG